jgi:hypothetical protein
MPFVTTQPETLAATVGSLQRIGQRRLLRTWLRRPSGQRPGRG